MLDRKLLYHDSHSNQDCVSTPRLQMVGRSHAVIIAAKSIPLTYTRTRLAGREYGIYNQAFSQSVYDIFMPLFIFSLYEWS